MKYRNWQIPYTAPQPPEALLRAGYSPLLAVLLALRGYADPGQARDFLSGGDQSVFDPMLLQDMDKAVARIRTAIERRENVAVFGDYDVDGITSTCVLTDYLRRQGVPVHPYIPDRIEEGYGLNMDAITSLQRTSDITLIITVDCGITAIDETNYALQRGIDMVITDHHECSGQAIPNAVAVVDPKRPGSQYPNSGLAGVGVAYKLLCALEGGSERVLREYGDLVAIGTVADVMPLTGENRYLVAQGLAQINARPRPGIRALLHECGAEGRPVTATTIGFTLAPRINAAGRLGKTAVAALLLTEKALPGLGRLPGALRHGYVLLAVILSFVLFNAETLAQAGSDFAALFGFGGLPLFTKETGYYLRSYAPLLVIACIGATPLVRRTAQKWEGNRVLQAAEPILWLGLLLVCTAYLVDGSFSPFLYFRF